MVASIPQSKEGSNDYRLPKPSEEVRGALHHVPTDRKPLRFHNTSKQLRNIIRRLSLPDFSVISSPVSPLERCRQRRMLTRMNHCSRSGCKPMWCQHCCSALYTFHKTLSSGSLPSRLIATTSRPLKCRFRSYDKWDLPLGHARAPALTQTHDSKRARPRGNARSFEGDRSHKQDDRR